MKTLIKKFIVCIIFISSFCNLYAGFKFKMSPEEIIQNSRAILEEMMDVPEESIPKEVLKDAYAIAIIPNVMKVGFIFGGRFGQGILVVKLKDNKWSYPVFIKLSGGSFGYQIGAQTSDVILVFKHKKSVDGIVNSKFTLGANVNVAAGPIGMARGKSTDILQKADILTYTRSRGFFAGITMEGAVLEVDLKLNAEYYKRDLPVHIILTKDDLKVPKSAKQLLKTLEKFTK
ncbi:MAG: lipid-binding SYLF domain-containing protein [Epsilonproteobacteria bacterium]|nr:lipid-binding SYLF domain-containing protein [Campylobacterota bacterium]